MHALVFALGLLAAGGIMLPLDHQAIQDALSIANSSLESTHRRFHADYRFPVNAAPVDFVSLVSPFRRLVLAAETGERLGRRMFGQREALAALQPDPDRFEVYAELTFHPHNTFVQVPDYSVELEPLSFRGPTIEPTEIDRLPRFGPRVDEAWYPFPYPYAAPNVPPGSQPLAGATLVARFPGHALDPNAIYTVVISERSRALARTRVDLARLR
ncbi:MAG: hypothetical protein ACRD26_04530 [Vicinamibacterales bacterium]